MNTIATHHCPFVADQRDDHCQQLQVLPESGKEQQIEEHSEDQKIADVGGDRPPCKCQFDLLKFPSDQPTAKRCLKHCWLGDERNHKRCLVACWQDD